MTYIFRSNCPGFFSQISFKAGQKEKWYVQAGILQEQVHKLQEKCDSFQKMLKRSLQA